RLPFLLAGPLGVVGLYIRLRLDESPQFERLERTGQVVRHPLREAIVRGWREILLAGGIGIVVHLGYFLALVYMPTYLTKVLGFEPLPAFLATTTVVVLNVIVIPISGRLSDRWGRKPIMMAAAIGFVVATVPVFLLISQGGAATF